MFLGRFRRRSAIRRRKSERETLQEDAARFKDLVVSRAQEKGLAVPLRLLKELQRASQQRDAGRRLYKLDLHRAKLTDPHVEYLADALKELPVLRKLDLRGNDLTDRAVRALTDVLKDQVELFRLVHADASFLYSVKFDPAVLSLDRECAEELEAYVAVLDLADSILDVRHAFFQIFSRFRMAEARLKTVLAALNPRNPPEADVRETGTLTEHELGDAMRIVVGTMPKAAETARVLRFFGQRGGEGKPPLIDLGGFEAAMAGRLRETRTIPDLTQGCENLLFGPTSADGDHPYTECYSPWSTRSHGTLDIKRSGDNNNNDDNSNNRTVGGKWSSSLATSPGRLRHSAGTQVLSVPPRQHDGEAGGAETTELGETLMYDGGADDSEMEWSAGCVARKAGRKLSSRDNSNSEGVSSTRAFFLQNRTERSLSRRQSARRRTSSGASEQQVKDKGGADCGDHYQQKNEPPKLLQVSINQRNSCDEESTSPATATAAAPAAPAAVELVGQPNAIGNSKELQQRKSSGTDRLGTARFENHLNNPRSTAGSPGVGAADDDRGLNDAGGGGEISSRTTPAREGNCSSGENKAELSDNDETSDSDEEGRRSTPRQTTALQHGEGETLDEHARGRGDRHHHHRHGDGGRQQALIAPSIGGDHDSPLDAEGDEAKGGAGANFERGFVDSRQGGRPRGSQQAETEGSGGFAEQEQPGNEASVAEGTSAGFVERKGPGTYGCGKQRLESVQSAELGSESLQMATLKEDGRAESRDELVLPTIPSTNQSAEEVPPAPCHHTMLSATRVAEGLQQSDATAIVDTQATEVQTPGTSNAPLATSGMIADSSEGSTNKKIVTPATPIAAKVAPLATENNGPAGVLPVAVASGADATTTSGDQNVPNPSTSLALDLAGSRSTPSVTAEPVGPRDAIDVSNAVDPVTTAAGGALLENRGPHVVSPPPTGPASESPEKLVQGDQKCTDAFTTGGPLLRVGAGNSGELEADKSRQQTATGMIATPWCLAPANIHARARAGQPAAMYEERRRLAARIALISSSPSEPLCGDAAASKGGGSGGENLNKRTLVDESEEVDTATGRAAGHTSGAFKTASPTRHNVSSGAVRVSGLSSHVTSPESRGVVHGGRDEGESPHNAGAWSFGIGGSASCFGQVDKGKEGACGPGVQIGGSHASGLHHGEEKILEIRLEEGALFMSRNGLGSTGVVLKLEATHGYGRDCLLALHTLVLSYNQVQVLDYSVLATMPALRHLDVSHNLLCRMEPMDGHELPSRLETLNMSHNRISRIGGISQCGALRVLDLSHNQIKSTLGLGHLLLLEQLDLSHNLISKAVSARALSFNRSLKLLRLEGNPFAADPRYRATLTCLLPHLRAIDRKGMPPSSSLERRGFGGDSGESTAWAGGGARGKVVSREFQEEQDERRSNEWRQMMASREEIAQRQIEADERKTRERYQIANPVKQRQLAEELARPHRRAHASKDTTSRTKDITCSRPTIAFGVTYRQPSTDTSPTSFPSRRRQNSQQMRSSNLMGHPQPQDPSACSEDGGTRDGTYKAGNAENGSPRSHQDRSVESIIHSGDEAIVRDFPTASADTGRVRAYSSTAVVMSSTDCHDEVGRFNVSHADFPNNDPLHTTHGGVEDSTSPKTTKPNHFTSNGILQPQQQYCHQQTVGVHDGGAESLVSTSGDQNGVTRGMHVDDTEDVNCTRDLPDERGRATEGDTDDSVLDPSQRSVLEEWLKDVEQETETAATALKVLLKMHQQRGIKRCGSRRLAGFRAALDGMGLFTEQFGASPDFVGEEGVHADRVLTAARRVAMTKAAVKNMLRLMEAEPAGSPELDQYAHFVVQQDEIVLEDRSLDGARPTRGSESGGRDAASNGAETTREVDYADPSTCASTTGLPTPPLVRYGAHGDDTGQYSIEAGTSHVNMLSTVVSDGRQVNLHNGSGSVPRVDHDGGDVGLDVADGGKRDRSSHSHGDTGATAHPLPGSDWRRRTSESTPVERAAGLDAIELNVAGRDVAGVNKDSAREVISEEYGVMASPIATGASVVQVVGNDSMRLGQEMTISKPLVDMPPRENCAQAGERDHRGSDIAQARINECAATLHPGPGQTDVQPPLENFSVDPTHRPAATMVTIGVVAIGHKGDEETDVKGVRPASGGICRQREEHTPDNMDAPAASGVSSEVLSNVHLAAITTTAESTLAAADSSAMKPCETRLSQPPPLPPATATTVPIAAMIDPGTGPNTLAAPENLSIESRAQVSRRAQEMSATDPRDPAAGSRASTDGGISHPPAAAAGDATDVAAVRESPSAIVAVRKSSTSEEDRLENQCPVLCNNNIESATEATLLEPSAHLSIRERLLRRARASADNSGIPATTSDSDPDRTNDCEKDDSDRLEDDGQDTSVHATATEEKGEEKPVDQSAKYVAGQGNEGGDTVDSVAADDDDQLSSNNDIDISHCQQSAGNINEEADSAVCQPAEEAIARPEAVDSTTTGPDGDDGKTGTAGSRIVAPEASQDLRSLDVQSHRTGDGEGVPNICADGAAEDPPSSVAVREQTSSKREEAGLDQTNKPDVVGNPLYDVQLYDPTRLEGGISGVPVVGIEGAFPVKTTVEDTGARAGSDSATEKGDGGDGENEVGKGSVAEKESASSQPDLVRARDGDGGRRDDSHDDGSPADSVANSSRESRAKMNAPRSGEGETTGDDAKVGVIIEAAGGGGEVLSADAKSVRDEKAAELVDIEPEWIEGYDPSHDCYYYHHVATGESSWFKPDAPYEPYVHSDEDEDDGVEEDVAVLEGNEEEREGARKEREGRNGAKPSSRRTSKGDPGHRSPDPGDESKKGKYASTGKKQKRQNGHDSKSRRGSEDHHERRKGGRSTNGTSSGKKRSSSPTAGASRTRSSPGIVHEPYASENSRSNSESRSVSRSSDDLDSRRFGKTGGRSGNIKTTDNRREADRERRSSRSNKSAARNEESKASDTRRGGGERDGDGDLDTGRRRRRRKTGSGVQNKSALDRLNDLTDENVRTSDSSSASDFDVRVGRNTRRDGKHRRDAEDKRRHDYSEVLPGSGSPSRHHRRSRSPGSGGVAVRGHGTTLRDEGAEPSSSRRRSDFSSSSSRRYSSPSGGRRRDQDRRASFSAGNNVVGGSSSRREKERSSRRGSRSGDRDN